MDDSKNYIQDIRSILLKNIKPSYETTNHKEIHVRCPYCGDSKHDKSKARFYIEMRPPFRFHCFKCETSGVLNQQVLRDLGVYNNDLTIDLAEANKFVKGNGVQKISTKSLKNLIHENPYSEIAKRSLNYFNSRFHSNFDPLYVQKKFRCVLDAPAFFALNHIYAKGFDFNNAIGFISSDKSHIIFRDTSGTQQRRYCNVCLVDEDQLDICSKMYNISGGIDVMQESVDLIITEGIFDIIGVYNYLHHDENDNHTIFAACCGKGYNAVIQHYLRLGFLDMNVMIFSDSDVDIQFFKDLKNNSVYLKNSRITVVKNALYDPETKTNKDFGVPTDSIKLNKIII